MLVSGPIRPVAGHGSAATECEHSLGVRIIRMEPDRIWRLPAGIGVRERRADQAGSALAARFLVRLGGCSQRLGDEVEIAVFFEECGGT